eukprot:CAMPEP_0171068796 /NCGR_PEP_ID=MMETSP0766_2-20121228/8782_1 /TAXON_ID=439317 /ORGANISM="Gambierdiscus australes, Strain CAWD 149" /LENGTH=114 /DNA_ID=CAMNT_0011525145 /DNA_START=170 /DNA_END=515 /DNA_ORIENTATION=-
MRKGNQEEVRADRLSPEPVVPRALRDLLAGDESVEERSIDVVMKERSMGEDPSPHCRHSITRPINGDNRQAEEQAIDIQDDFSGAVNTILKSNSEITEASTKAKPPMKLSTVTL